MAEVSVVFAVVDVTNRADVHGHFTGHWICKHSSQTPSFKETIRPDRQRKR